MKIPPIVGLEIGTSKTVALIAEVQNGGDVIITGMGSCQSVGVRKGEIVDLENATACAKIAIGQAEDSAGVDIGEVYLAANGVHIQSVVSRGNLPIPETEGSVSREDMDNIFEIARAISLPPDREVLYAMRQYYCVDDLPDVISPEGMQASKFSLDVLVLHGIRNRLKNTVKAAQEVPVRVADVAISGLCSSLAVLTPEQRAGGTVVIDLGGGNTSYVACYKNITAAVGTLAIGGDHLTNDIQIAFHIPMAQAERLKIESGNAMLDVSSTAQRLEIPPDLGFAGRSVIVRSLHKVINLRVEETLRLVKRRLDWENMHHKIGVGVLLTGGGANMCGIVPLAERIFDVPCSVGMPVEIGGIVSEVNFPEPATCVGLVKYGAKTAMAGKNGRRGFLDLIRTFMGYNPHRNPCRMSQD